MPPESMTPGSPADWLRHARSDLAVAEGPAAEEVLIETLCYHAQQAAEKSLKAVLVHYGIEFPYTHNIARLITIGRDSNLQWRDDLDEAAELTQYAVESRYPGVGRPLGAADRDLAVLIARKLLTWAERTIEEARAPEV